MVRSASPPRGKRQLAVGPKCVRRNISLPLKHLQLLDDWSKDLPGGRSEFIRRMIDERASIAVAGAGSAE